MWTGAARVLPRRGVVRSDNEAVVVNLDITPVEKPEAVRWVDPIHKWRPAQRAGVFGVTF